MALFQPDVRWPTWQRYDLPDSAQPGVVLQLTERKAVRRTGRGWVLEYEGALGDPLPLVPVQLPAAG